METRKCAISNKHGGSVNVENVKALTGVYSDVYAGQFRGSNRHNGCKQAVASGSVYIGT